MSTRLLATLAAASVVGAAFTAAAPPAGAATIGTCRLLAPSQVRVVQPYQAISVSITGGCTLRSGTSAFWNAYHSSQGPVTGVSFDGTSRSVWDLYDSAPQGSYTWRPGGAWDTNTWDTYTQDTVYTQVKVGSWAGVYPRRSGTRVTLPVRAVRYSPTWSTNIPWPTTGTIQYRSPGSSTWTGLKNITTDSSGNATWSYTTSTRREYRVVLNGNAGVWPATSAGAPAA